MHNVFKGALKTGEIAGAYLIEGSEGWARAQAEEFLGALFCETGKSCGVCPACRKIAAGFHPDILRIDPGRKSIKVEDIRDSGLFEWLSRKSYEGGYKAVVIPNADTMVDQTQNKLLKAIEEPPEKTVFLLSAGAGKNILPTVLSRCIIIRMRGEDKEAVREDVKRRFSLSTMSAQVLASTAGCDPYRASELYGRNFFETRESAVRAAKRLLNAKNRASSVILDLLLKHQENLDDVFLALQSFARDILVFKNTGDERLLVNADQILDIRDFARRLPNRKLALVLASLQETEKKRKLCAGILKKLMLQDMLFEILEVVLA